MPAINISIPKRELREITAFCKERGINRSRFLREKAMDSIRRVNDIETNKNSAAAIPKWPKDKVDFSQCPLALWIKTIGE